MSEAQVQSIYKVTDDTIYGFFKEHRFLSNFHLCEIEYEGRPYTSTEAAYQAAKTLDVSFRIPFEKYSPADAKSMGRFLNLRIDWDEIKGKVMYDLLKQKFTKHEYLKSLLLGTGNKYLEETNWWKDDYWGVYEGEGKNMLGRILLQVREEIRNPILVSPSQE